MYSGNVDANTTCILEYGKTYEALLFDGSEWQYDCFVQENLGEKKMTFYDKMRIVCLAIPQGKVAIYGQIAMLCGKPKNSRQVGYGLRENLAGSDIPSFRIANGKGELSGAFRLPVLELQKTLLGDEGVEVFLNGSTWCLDLKKYGRVTVVEDMAYFADEFKRNENTST